MDRKPPDPPVLAAKPPIYSDKSYSIRYKAADSSISTYVSLSTEKKSVLFKRFEKDIELAGSAVGPISYTIRSYSIDRAGNRSVEAEPTLVVIDTNTLYADTAAKDSGDGSPFKPFRTIDAVLAESSRTGKSNIYLRGKFELTTALAVDRDLAIQGGFTADWDIDPSNRSELRLVAPRNPSAFTVRAAKLALRGLAMTSSSTGSAPIILVDRGELTLEEVALSARGEGDIIMLRAESSKVFLQHASLTAVQAMSCTALNVGGSSLSIQDSIISARPGVRIFNAVDQKGGSLEIRGSLLESSADLALRLISLRDATLLMDRSLARVEGGSGYLRLGSFRSVTGEIRSSKFDVSWKGAGTLFEIESTGPSFRHDTILAGTSKGNLRFFEIAGSIPEIWNCILSCSSGGGELIRSIRAPGPGTMVSDCIWGFDILVAGAVPIRNLASLDALNAGSIPYSSRRHIAEPPTRSFAATEKGQISLGSASACIDAAFILDGSYSLDFMGRARPSPFRKGLPDIGADEYYE
jgi:hypothetical protein